MIDLNRIPLRDMRRERAIHMAAEIMKIASKYMETLEAQEEDYQRRFMKDLHEFFCNSGIDIITDYDREQAGLPSRGPLGWTAEELAALETKRLKAMYETAFPRLRFKDGTLTREIS